MWRRRTVHGGSRYPAEPSADRADSTTPADQSAQFRLTAIHDEPAPPAQLQESFTATTFTARTTAPVAATPRQALLAEPATLVHVATSLVDAILTPFLAPGPATPAQPPLAWALLAWVRREIDQSVLNLATPARPQHVISQLADVAAVQSPNLLVNPGAELGDPSLSGYSSVTVPGWTLTGTPTVIEYGTQRRFPVADRIAGPDSAGFLAFPSREQRIPTRERPAVLRRWTRRHSDTHPNRRPQRGRRRHRRRRRALHAEWRLGGFLIDPSRRPRSPSTSWTRTGSRWAPGTLEPVTALDRWFFRRAASTATPPGRFRSAPAARRWS